MKSKKKVRVNKYRLGTQQVAVPNKGSIGDIAASTTSLASTGGALGGPVGAVLGGAVGLGKGIMDYSQANNQNRIMTDRNKYIEKNDLMEDPMLMQQQFKKGTRYVKAKYPGGTKSINLGPEYAAAQAKIKEFEALRKPGDWSIPATDSLRKYMGQANDILQSKYGAGKTSSVPFDKNKVSYLPESNTPLLANFPMYKNGTKEIEVEKDELIFHKKGNKYVLKADFKGGKTHNAGGENYTASEGDIIFPGAKRKKVLNAYKKGDTATLESMRMNLPKDEVKVTYGDGGQIFTNTAKGDKGSYRYNQGKWGWDQTGGNNFTDIEDPTGVAAIEQRLAGKFTPYTPNTQGVSLNPIGIPDIGSPYGDDTSQGLPMESGVDRENLYATPASKLNTISPKLDFNQTAFNPDRKMSPVPISEFSNPYAGTDLEDAQKQGITKNKFDAKGALSTGLELAPVIYNTVRGLSKPEKVQRNYYTPERYQYQDISAPARRAAQEAQNVDKYNVNTTRGSRGQIQSYLQQASNNKYKRLADIGNFEGGRKMDVYNQNIGQDNQAKLTNLQLSNNYNTQDAQNKARRNDFQAAAVGQVSDFSQKQKLMANQTKRDKALMDMQQKRIGLYDKMYADYGLDPETMDTYYKGSKTRKYKKGTRRINRY